MGTRQDIFAHLASGKATGAEWRRARRDVAGLSLGDVADATGIGLVHLSDMERDLVPITIQDRLLALYRAHPHPGWCACGAELRRDGEGSLVIECYECGQVQRPDDVCCAECWGRGWTTDRAPCKHRRPHPCGCPHLRAGDVCAAHEAERFRAGNLERLRRMSSEQRATLGEFAEECGQMMRSAVCAEHHHDPLCWAYVEEAALYAPNAFARFVEASR